MLSPACLVGCGGLWLIIVGTVLYQCYKSKSFAAAFGLTLTTTLSFVILLAEISRHEELLKRYRWLLSSSVFFHLLVICNLHIGPNMPIGYFWYHCRLATRIWKLAGVVARVGGLIGMWWVSYSYRHGLPTWYPFLYTVHFMMVDFFWRSYYMLLPTHYKWGIY